MLTVETILQAETLSLSGVVSSGLGEGRMFTSLPWAASEFERKLGFVPYPGTFNLTMTGETWERARNRMLTEPGIAIEPAPGFCDAKCHWVVIGEQVAGAVVIPDISEYPHDKLEILCPIPVRRTLTVSDGHQVSIKVALDVNHRRDRDAPQVASGAMGGGQ